VIDERAVIDPSAELDEGVKVGAFTVIGPKVRIAAGSEIGCHVVIKGPTDIGRDNRVYPFATIGEDPQDLKYAGEETRLVIGDRNRIREYTTLHRGTIQDEGVTRIGSDNLFMAYTHVAHDCRIADNCILSNGASLAGHAWLGEWAILGGFVGVHQFCRVGAHSFTAAGAILFKDLPPYVTAGGTPVAPHGINREGLKRRGFSEDALKGIRRAYKALYKQNLKLDEAQLRIREIAAETPEVTPMLEFIEASQRSILR
jgi:UDP-N-acetylglucosamine acyltransferase